VEDDSAGLFEGFSAPPKKVDSTGWDEDIDIKI